MSAMHVQCSVRHVATFSASEHHSRLTGTILYCYSCTGSPR